MHRAYGRCSQPIHHFWDRAKAEPGKCANGDLVQIVPGAINCVLDFFIIMLVSHPAHSLTSSRNANSNTADTFALAATHYGFTERGLDWHLRLRRIVSRAHDGPAVERGGCRLSWRDLIYRIILDGNRETHPMCLYNVTLLEDPKSQTTATASVSFRTPHKVSHSLTHTSASASSA